MNELRHKQNKVICSYRVNGEDDLKPRPGMNINPPPDDGRCHCCGRHINELQPFGKSGDPADGDFEGAYLIKTFRREVPYNEEAERAVDEAEYCCRDTGSPYDWMVAKYGQKKGSLLYAVGQGSATVGASWECRDCILLNEDEYFQKLYSRSPE